MQLHDISINLRDNLQAFNQNPLMISPYETANFLKFCNDALLNYVQYSNSQLSHESQGYVSEDDAEKINALFRELSDNFFPMAHTDTRLGLLKIIESRRLDELNEQLREMSYLSQELQNRMDRILQQLDDR